MPIYEYYCAHCDTKFELLRAVSKANEGASCVHCHKEARRIPSRFSSLAKDVSGVTSPIGGNSCSGCSSSTCSTCGG